MLWVARLCISGYVGGVIHPVIRALADTLRTLAPGLVWAAAIGGFGLLCVAGAKAAARYHHRVDQPQLSHVSCRWHDGRVVVSGVVENPNSGTHRVLVHIANIDVVDDSIVSPRLQGLAVPGVAPTAPADPLVRPSGLDRRRGLGE